MQSFPHTHDAIEIEAEMGELAEDIQQQAEQIRRERMSKRAKAAAEAEKIRAQQEAERILVRTTSLAKGHSQRGDGPLVGNLIGEDHVNYVLMYNMLTGIRIAVCAPPGCASLLLISSLFRSRGVRQRSGDP